MKPVRISQINDLLEVCPSGVYISDFKVCEEMRRPQGAKQVNSKFTHLRAKKIQRWASKEGAGQIVKAYGFDELSNVIAILPNNSIVQFIGTGRSDWK